MKILAEKSRLALARLEKEQEEQEQQLEKEERERYGGAQSFAMTSWKRVWWKEQLCFLTRALESIKPQQKRRSAWQVFRRLHLLLDAHNSSGTGLLLEDPETHSSWTYTL